MLGLLTAFGPISTDIYLPALPQVGDALSAPPAAVQLTLSASVIGLALGQLLVGPLSDRYGRRRPLLCGLAVFATFSFACTAANSAAMLTTMRFGQALGGAAGLVIARAVARDTFTTTELPKVFGILTSVAGLAPVLGPLIGGQLLTIGTWRTVFLALGMLGIVLWLATYLWVPESLDQGSRIHGGAAAALSSYRTVLGDRAFMVFVLMIASLFSALFSYIAAGPFILQVAHDFTPQQYSIAFAANAVCLSLAAQQAGRLRVNHRLVGGAGILTVATGMVGIGVAADALPPLLLGFGLGRVW